jgi:hypothetical protein
MSNNGPGWVRHPNPSKFCYKGPKHSIGKKLINFRKLCKF